MGLCSCRSARARLIRSAPPAAVVNSASGSSPPPSFLSSFLHRSGLLFGASSSLPLGATNATFGTALCGSSICSFVGPCACGLSRRTTRPPSCWWATVQLRSPSRLGFACLRIRELLLRTPMRASSGPDSRSVDCPCGPAGRRSQPPARQALGGERLPSRALLPCSANSPLAPSPWLLLWPAFWAFLARLLAIIGPPQNFGGLTADPTRPKARKDVQKGVRLEKFAPQCTCIVFAARL